MTTRRHFLEFAATVGIACHWPAIASAQGQGLSTSPIAPGFTLIAGAGGNVVVAEGPDSVVVVNGGLQEHAEALLAKIRELTGNKPIAALFNTNWWPQNSGLNHLLGPQGTPIIAHENTRLWQNAGFYSEWQDKHHEPLPKEVQANRTFYKTGTLMLGDETIEYGFISQMNTDGDIYVHFTRADVLVVGDMLGAGAYPLLDYVTGGWVVGAQKTTAGLLARASDATKVIAASGGVLGKAELQAQAAMLDHAYDKVAEAFKTGRSLPQFQEADPMAEFNSTYGDPTLFLALLYKSTWYRIPGRAIPGII